MARKIKYIVVTSVIVLITISYVYEILLDSSDSMELIDVSNNTKITNKDTDINNRKDDIKREELTKDIKNTTNIDKRENIDVDLTDYLTNPQINAIGDISQYTPKMVSSYAKAIKKIELEIEDIISGKSSLSDKQTKALFAKYDKIQNAYFQAYNHFMPVIINKESEERVIEYFYEIESTENLTEIKKQEIKRKHLLGIN